MEDSGGKVRLVRCPKCENLLPELADYSVYQCGGCGAVLKAKGKDGGSDALSQKSDEERRVVASEKPMILSEQDVVRLSNASDREVKPSAGCDQNLFSEENETRYGEMGTNNNKDTTDKWVIENGLNSLNNINKVNGSVRDNGELLRQGVSNSGSQKSGEIFDRRVRHQNGMEGFQRNMHAEFHGMRPPTSSYPDEGPSNYRLASSYSREMPCGKPNELDDASRVRYLERDRAELLRKLDELKDQLSRSCDVGDIPKGNAPLDRKIFPPHPYGGPDAPSPDASAINKASMQFHSPYKHHSGPSYASQYPELYPSTDNHDLMHNLYPSMQNSNHFPGYGDSYVSEVHRRDPGHYRQPPPYRHFPVPYADANSIPLEPFPHKSVLHHPSCSCVYCYDNLREISAPVRSATFQKKRFLDVSNNHMLYHHEYPAAYGSQLHDPRRVFPPFDPCEPQLHIRRQSDLNYEMGGFVHPHPQRMHLSKGGRCCDPIVGGAPFILCPHCFELLQLPSKHFPKAKKHQKLRCGSCSSVIMSAFSEGKIVFSLQTGVKQAAIEYDDDSCEDLKGYMHSHGYMKRGHTNFSSDDFDNLGYEFHAMDRQPISSSTGHYVSQDHSQDMDSLHSSSPSISDDDNSPDTFSTGVVNSVQQTINATRSPLPPSSPLLEHFNYSSYTNAANRFGKGNRSARSEQEKALPNKNVMRQNSLNEASLATEMDVSFNEFSNTVVSQESADTSKEDEIPRNNKGSLVNIIKKSFKDLSRSNQSDEHGKAKVSINGHPVPDRAIKKAEKLAGPIHPGKFWYDFRAGFWGVMGGPCLGIIPPLIEELNYSMPEKCAGGDTGVFVNGRELHRMDLDLLAKRGLPTDRDRSYIIDISGRVLDGDTGEELDCLGKLAPTVEKMRRGFGMKVPREADC